MNPKKPNNSYKSYIATLRNYPEGMSENLLNIYTFGYNRSTSREANKKYADMLRRAVSKGYIKRREKPKSAWGSYTYIYYV
jgi:hypothetical protein